MAELISEGLMQTPSVRDFLDRLLDDLAHRRSLIVLLPSGVDPEDLWQVLLLEIRRRDIFFEEVWLPDLPEEGPPAASLGKALQVKWAAPDTPHTAHNLTEAKGLPELIRLSGFEELSGESRTKWLRFLEDWAIACQNLAHDDFVAVSICLPTLAAAVIPEVPKSNVNLSVRWWWGFPSALEVQLLCRFGVGDTEDLSERWREYLVMALAGNDTSLADHLWEGLREECSDPLPCLRTFGEMRGWTAEVLQEYGAQNFLTKSNEAHKSRSATPPVQWYLLWAQGALCWTREYGLELHSSALAILKQDEGIRHRLWRGQAALLLPIIDSVRIAVCGYLTQRHRKDWPSCWHTPESSEEAKEVRENPLSCQWGYLEWLLRNCVHLSTEQQRLLPLVRRMKHMRNELAHYRQVSLTDFEGLHKEAARVQKLGIFLPGFV